MKLSHTVLFYIIIICISVKVNAGTKGQAINNSFQYDSRRIALVVGNWDYKIGPLRNPEADSRELAQTLKSLGFDVTYIRNADRASFREAIRTFGNKLYNYNVGLFFYAGHGLQVNGVNYLIPIDADITTEDEIQDEAIQAELVLRKMQSAANFLNIVILDACRNNPFVRSFRSSLNGLARMDAPKGTLISYSTAPGSTASDGAGVHSPFAKHLIKNIMLPGIPVEEIFKRVRIGVDLETFGRQTTWESSSLMGDFYFAKMPEGKKRFTGMLEVNVQNMEGELFVDNAKVTILEKEKIAFVALIPGWHSIAIKKGDSILQTKRVFISAGNVTYIDQIVEKPKYEITRQNQPNYKTKKRVSLPPP